MTCNSFHTRINEHSLSFGMVRYSDGKTDTYHQEDAFWRCVISHYCGRDKLATFDASVSDLVQLKVFCDRALETLRTDGGRKEQRPVEAA